MPSRTRQQSGQLGLFRPESNWVRPSALPDLRGRRYLALDTETHDVGLSEKTGPGWATGKGRLLGVSWAAEGSVGYAPIDHPDSDNFDRDAVIRWVDDHFRSGVRIVMHNGSYDLGWLGSYGVAPPVKLEDTLAACVMIDENEYSYSLEECCKRAKIPGKDTELLEHAVEVYGGVRKKARADLWRVPANYVGPYAEADAVATLALWHQTEPALHAQEVWAAYRTEAELIPMVVAMRRRGIRLDLDRAEATAREFRQSSHRALATIGELLNLGRPANLDEIRSPKQMEQWFAREHIAVPRTAKGRSSFTKDWMEKSSHPLPPLVSRALQFEDAASKFIDNFLFGFEHRGRIHAEIHQFRSDTGGTRSHRFSYSEPPLQQMPTPDKDNEEDRIGYKIRRCFLPEKGEAWLAADYSQQEPRLTVHFAFLCKARGADVAVERYLNNPRTDYHSMVAETTGLPRATAKILNLSMTYGKGKHSLAEELGISVAEAEVLLQDYHARLPFIKSLEDICKTASSQRGYIKLIDGARMHYPQWEGGWVDWEVRKIATAAGKILTPCSRADAEKRQADEDHPWAKTKLRRADTRKTLNNLIQGSAARQTKRAMLACWNEGIIPLIQMHDELGASIHSEAQAERIGEIMRDTTPLVVPTIVDLEVGQTWGEAKMKWAAYAAQLMKVA